MTLHTLYCSSYFPNTGIAQIEGKRRAQIVAKLMCERFPDFTFGYAPSPILTAPNTNHFLEIGVRTIEVTRLTQKEIEDEAEANPDGLEKWLMFIFDNGEGPDGGPQCSAYLEHDFPVVKRCKADPTLAEIIPIYSEQPSMGDLEARLDAWAEART
ncbi:hypothetical protein [Jannaschia marina]|uniref:hypothetical protein n=1 Tax=Jannaschia marina TaxID=2741674 RepID=UPI0015CC492F|nr:hypothetical protein [Jannaschia marina]